MELLTCPLCGEQREHRVRYRFAGRRTVVCAVCDLEHVDPKPTKAALRELYDSGEYFQGGGSRRGYRDYEGERRSIHLTSGARLDRLSGLVAGRRLLDVGAGLGYFLDVAAKRGFDVTGLELSSFAGGRLRQRHPTLQGALWEHAFDEPYDIVVLFDTVEHIIDIRRLKHAIIRALRPGGILAFTTPDNRSLARRILGKSWWSYRFPEHVVLFNERSARRWLGEEFEMIASDRDRQFMELGRAAERLADLSPALARIFRFLIRATGLHKHSLRLPNANRFYIARRK